MVIKRINEYVSLANQSNWETFFYRNPNYVLVLIPGGAQDTGPINTIEFQTSPPESRPPLNEDYRVGILDKRMGGNPFDCFITIGRAKNNDIIVKDIEVSKVHAFFEKDQEGRWSVRDNKSTNGTFVNNLRIPTGTKTDLRSSDALKFGPGLSAVFFNPGDFYQFLKSPEVVASFKQR